MSLSKKIWIRNSNSFPFSTLNVQELLPLEFRNLVGQSIFSRKENGVFIEFTQDVDLLKVNSYLQENSTLWRRFTGKQVKGDPFIQDLLFEKVSRRLKVLNSRNLQSKEQVFKEFRKYGKLLQVMDAVDAKLCLDYKGDIGYEKFTYDFKGFKWINEHPRIVLPILLGVIGILSLVVFDPIRVFMIENEIKQEKDESKTALRNLRKYLDWEKRGSGRKMKKNLEQKEILEKIQVNLEGRPENIMLVNGPSGSGKSQLVKEAIKNRKSLVIDTKLVVTEHYSRQLAALASQINYFPDFSGFNFIGKMVDSFIGILTGAKITPVDQLANLSATEKEYRQILDCLTVSLSRIVYKQKSLRPETESNSDVKIEYPVVVIDGYLNNMGHGSTGGGTGINIIFKVLEEWAAFVMEQKIAHIVFISDAPMANKALLEVLENRPLDLYTLSDSTRENAISFIKDDLGDILTPEEYDKCIDVVGGRLTDLQRLVSRLKSGRSLQDCLDDIRDRAIHEVSKIGLSSKEGQWSPIQFWKIVQLLSRYDEVDFDNLKYHQLFNGNSSAILAMERCAIISICRDQGKELYIKPGRPILRCAFKEMSQDPKLIATLGLETTKALLDSESKKLLALEQELLNLSTSYSHLKSWFSNREVSSSLRSRILHLSKEIKTSNMLIQSLNSKISEYKTCLKVKE